MNEYVIVGKVGTTYGIKGWLKIVSFTESTADILDYDPWYLEEKNAWKQVKISDAHEHGKGVIAKFADIETPEQARLLTGKSIAIQRSQLATLKKDEYYWADLKGLTVINHNGEELGKIIYLIATGSNDVLVVKGDKEHAIPYLPGETVISIDLAKQTMHVNWEML